MAESIMLKEMFSGQSSRDVQGRILGIGPEKARRRVMVIGLDCAAPELVFDRWLDDLPNLKSLSGADCTDRFARAIRPLQYRRGR